MNEQIEQWIPWYVNGTLGASERVTMDHYLRNDADARAEVALFQSAAAALKLSADRVPADRGLNEALTRIRAEKTTQRSTTQSKTTSSSAAKKPAKFIDSLRAWFGTSWTQPAFAFALIVIGAQSILLLRDPPDTMLMRGASPTAAASTSVADANIAYLRVGFKPTATEGEIRVLLAGSSASFVSGPGDDGAYIITVPEKNAIRALEVFKGSNIVALANPSAGPR